MKSRPFLRLVPALFLLAALGAEEAVIRSIVIEGPRRTRESVIRQLILPIREGAPFGPDSEEEIIQKLRAAGIFRPDITVLTALEEGAAEIRILVEDKWTLIPIPIVSVSNDAWRAGALVIESNLLGRNKTLGLGLFGGSEGWSLLSFFADDCLGGGPFDLSAGLSAGFEEVEDQNPEGEDLRTYRADKLGLRVSLSYPLAERLSLSAKGEFDRSRLRRESRDLPGLDHMSALGLGGELQWKDLYYDIPYERGLSAKASYLRYRGWEGSGSFPLIRAKLNASFSPWFKHLVKLESSAGWGDGQPLQQSFRLGGLPGSLTLPRDKIAAERYAAASLSYNAPLLSFSWGTLSGRVFYEGGLLEGVETERTLYHGPGTGLELFINNLAIPAVGLTIARNNETGLYQFSAGVGMGGGGPD